MDELIQQKSAAEEKLHKLEQRLKTCKDNEIVLAKELDELIQEKSAVEEKLHTLEKPIATLKAKLEKARTEQKQLQQISNSKHQELEELRRELEERSREQAKVKAEKEQLHAKVKEVKNKEKNIWLLLDKTIKHMRDKEIVISRLEAEIGKLEADKTQLERYNEQIKKLEALLEKAPKAEELARLSTSLKKAEYDRMQHELMLTNQGTQIKVLLEKQWQMSQELEASQRVLQERDSSIATLTVNLKKAGTEKEQLQQIFNSKHQELEELRIKLEERSQELATVNAEEADTVDYGSAFNGHDVLF
ncbi:golgin subfamily A member 6-like protein 22 [Dreissena polymorpha]|nr:golgin subfamily A member 6-like protein 22 [Dreissena polymorpha]